MRDLTKEELELAPSWATEYSVNEYEFAPNYTLFTDGINRSQWLYHDSGAMSPISICPVGIKDTKPIPRKTFYISEYELSDSIAIAGAEIKNEHLIIHRNSGSWDSYDKQDIIAMAKALGVTSEDL